MMSGWRWVLWDGKPYPRPAFKWLGLPPIHPTPRTPARGDRLTQAISGRRRARQSSGMHRKHQRGVLVMIACAETIVALRGSEAGSSWFKMGNLTAEIRSS